MRGTLIRVDALSDRAPAEGKSMILVICFAVAQDWISWKLDAIQRLPECGVHVLHLHMSRSLPFLCPKAPTCSDLLAVPIHKTAVVSPSLARMDSLSRRS